MVENCVQDEPPFTLYCQISAVAEDEADILKPFAVIFEVLKVTVGALRSMVVSVMLPPYSCGPKIYTRVEKPTVMVLLPLLSWATVIVPLVDPFFAGKTLESHAVLAL